MIQLKSRWKLGALLLIAPLTMSAPVRAGEPVDPGTGHTDIRSEAADLRDELKRRKTLRSADGDVYVFLKDGHFEYRRGKKSAKGMTYLNDYGRFTVTQKSYAGGSDGAAAKKIERQNRQAR